jgi:molecular chaperone HscB
MAPPVASALGLGQTDFELFGLPQRFAIDRADLDARWKTLQAQVHPDRFASADAQSQRQAMQWSVRVNEAYQRLKDPLKRAAYLCELHGAAIDAESNTAMPADFLMQQMAWREALEDANTASALDALADEVASHRRDAVQALQHTADERADFVALAQQVRALMFVERLRSELEQRLDRIDH